MDYEHRREIAEHQRQEFELARALEAARGKGGFWFVGNTYDAACEIVKALRAD